MKIKICMQKNIAKIDKKRNFDFGPRVYPMGFIVIGLLSPLVRWAVV